MIRKLWILAVIGALIGVGALMSYIPSVTGQSGITIDTESGDLTVTDNFSDYTEKGFIFGRITKLTYFWNVIAFEAVKIHVITFNPFNFNTYLADTTVSILNGYKGSLDTHFLCLWGKFSTISPESNIIKSVVNKKDPMNNSIQWVVTDSSFIHRSDVSWSVLDENKMNVSGTTVTVHCCDESSIMEGDTYDVHVEQSGIYTFCITYDASNLILFKSNPELYG